MRRLFLSILLAGLAVPGLIQAQTSDLEVPESEAACVEAGGRWARGGIAGLPLCFLPTPDAGKACTTAEDCTGFCLAETGTCSAESPLFGCFALFDLDGAEVTICID